MKKIEAIIRPGLRDAVVAAIKRNGVGGITIHNVQGQGSQDPPLIGQYFSSDMIICVIDDPKLD
ncbi:MAG: P-II family nitrogen regulator, partial [Nitrosopumilus sp.]